ncbi:MAG TPA: PBP1A family penicillin-binding protein [Acidimicrobiales bacterium]
MRHERGAGSARRGGRPPGHLGPRAGRRALAAALSILVGGGLAACSYTSRPLSVEVVPPAQTSFVYAADGTLITSLHAEQNREVVPLARMPQVLTDAVIAIEDSRYWTHSGVDVRALLRAALDNVSAGKVVEGASTIPEQYAKILLDENKPASRSITSKIREAQLAVHLEHQYSKAQILELYLNAIYFGSGAYGVQAASHVYFGVDVDALTLPQAALLAGLIQAPNDLDPLVHPAAAVTRRNQVLDRMASLNLVQPAAADAAKQAPVGVQAQATAQYPAPYFVDAVKQFILDDPRFGPNADARQNLLYRGGLRITTTLDLKRQAAAEQAVAGILTDPAHEPSAAVVSIDPRSGAVQALVGGQNYFGNGPQAKFNLATQGQRPAGSAFKPFVLATALEQGIGLDKVYPSPAQLDLPLADSQVWHVRNYEDPSSGQMNLLEATVHSINTVYAQLIEDVGPQQAVDTASRLGIQSHLQPYPSAVLGTNDVTPLEMASAYGTFATGGQRVLPNMVTKVTTADGTVLYQLQPSAHQVLDAGIAGTVTSALQQVVQRGTGVNANLPDRPVAGKTGTGEAWRDAWFVGYTPDLVTSVWVGYPDAQRSMVPPTTPIVVQGGSWPAMIWQHYMSAALAGSAPIAFGGPPVPAAATPPPAPTAPAPAAPAAPPTAGSVPVPLLVGQSFDQATATAGAATLTVTEHLVASARPAGTVVAQSPPPGTAAAGGAPVALDVSAGPPLPNVVGLAATTARQTLAAGGWSAAIVTVAGPPGGHYQRGRVWSETPAGGTTVAPGSTVTLNVAP